MGVRPFVTTGIAIASTGALIAAIPAITPPATPPDVTVAAAVPDSVYADVALRQSTQDLFNAFFSGYPDTTGPAGAVGLALLFSDELFGEDSLQSAFVSGGFVEVASVLTEANPVLNAFFAGGPNDTPGGIVGVLDLLTQDNDLANAFVTGGIVGVADVLTEGNELANTFVNEGFVGATELVLVSATAGDPVVSQGIQSFFSGYPFAVEDDPATEDDESLPAGPAGIVGLAHYILDRLAGNPTTPVMEELTVEQFSVPESGASLLAATTGPADTQDLPEANEPVNPGARTFNLNVGTQLRTGAVDSVDTIDPVETTDPTTLDTTDPTTLGASDPNPTLTPVAAATGAATNGNVPAAQPPVALTTPPAPDPVADPVDPADPVSNEKDGEESTETNLKSGNKFEPNPILFQNGRGGGGSAWDETVKRWQDFGSKLGFGGGAADADGAAEGSEAGS